MPDPASPHGGPEAPPPARATVGVTGLRGIPDIMGGVETHCEELLPRLVALDPALHVTVLARRPYMPGGGRMLAGVEIVPLPAPRRQSIEAIAATLVSVLHGRRYRYDAMHIHAIGPGLMTPLARLLGMRVIVTHHGADYDRAKWGRVARAMLRLGERASLVFANRVICVSPSLAETMRARFPRHAGKIRYIPNGAPTVGASDAAAPGDLAAMELSPGGYVLAVGRLVPEKGFHDLIDAFVRSGIDATLAIAGASDHASPYARDLLARGGERIRFLGQQPRHVLRHLYEQARLFVLPSYHEGLPIVALEAARAGTPVLLSDIQPNLDVGLGAANYVPVGDIEALAAALRRPASEFAVDADAVGRRFDWDEIARQTLAVYREVLR